MGNSFDSIYDFEAGAGGKFVRDRLWWFAAARKQGNNVARGSLTPTPVPTFCEIADKAPQDAVRHACLRP